MDLTQRLLGKTAVVTGAASGIGRATAQRLAAEGATVACVDVVADVAAETAAMIAESGGAATAAACDVTDWHAVESTVNGVRRLAGRVPDFRVRPEAISGVAIPVIAILMLLLVTTLWLDVTDPIRL